MGHDIMKSSASDASEKRTFTEEIKGSVSEIIQQVKKLVREGNARRIMIKNKKGKVLFQSQLTVGVAGTALLTSLAPVISAISMFALFMNDVKVVVERYPEGEGGEDEYEVHADAEVIEIEDEEEPDAPDEEESGEEEGK